jgi:16S rRNA U1498 N3-methylase RsmE
MSMTPDLFRRAVARLSDDELEKIITALGRSRTTAMQQSVRARIPECATFGGIAQDLDFALSRIEDEAVVSAGCPTKSSILKDVAKKNGCPVHDIAASHPIAEDMVGLPDQEGADGQCELSQ